MSLLKIVYNDIELDFVRETLTIKKENNALIRNFKVSHSSRPFLIVENEAAKKVLGPRDITSINKVKTIQVTVFENDIQYYGELQMLSYLKGFRKVNLKYASPLLEIMNKKISEFMPVVSVASESGEITPYSETSSEILSGDELWPDYVANFIDKSFPTVKWNFPMMLWKNKFGENLEEGDTWFQYSGKVNYFDEDGIYQLNTAVYTDLNYDIDNVNVPMPQVYLLSPLFYALFYLNYTYSGDFVTNAFIKKLMLLSTKTNLCVINPSLPEEEITLPDFEFSGLGYFLSIYEFTVETIGTYNVRYRFVEPLFLSSLTAATKTLNIFFDGVSDGYIHPESASARIYETGVAISVSASQLGKKIKIVYRTPVASFPVYDLSIQLEIDKEFQQMHPTIQTGRYCPDWTFGTYLNNIKNFFNLDVEIDDFAKKLEFNFNEDWIINSIPVVLQKSLAIKSYDQSPYNSFLLKYKNDEDTALWITSSGVEIYSTQESDFSLSLDSKFKYIPHEFGTSILSEEIDGKNGVGLIIYDETNFPLTAASFDGKTLKIDGDGGIYETFWKKFLKFRLNASLIEVEGGFTKTEIGIFLKTKRIYLDRQEYVVSVMDFKELKSDNYSVIFKLESINF